MKKTFFVEIVFNNKDKFIGHNRYLRAVVTAKDKVEAETKVVAHYKHLYTAGDAGVFKVQCNWQVKIPTREIIEKHWRAATQAQGSMPVYAPSTKMEIIGHREFQLDETKKDVMANWDYCNSGWAEPPVHYDISRGGYVISIHNYMALPSPLFFFKGVTRETFKKATKWVRDNTFQGDYYIPFKG